LGGRGYPVGPAGGAAYPGGGPYPGGGGGAYLATQQKLMGDYLFLCRIGKVDVAMAERDDAHPFACRDWATVDYSALVVAVRRRSKNTGASISLDDAISACSF
jgi:hypothetical protein